jgi:Dynamin family
VHEALIHWDTAFCWDNVQLVDTPGLNDPTARIRLSQDILPDIDAAIMVVSATEPFAESEGQLLAELVARIDPERLFFVNMIDRIAATERSTALSPISKARFATGLSASSGTATACRPGGCSASRRSSALGSRVRHDDVHLAQSRFPDFEAALRAYLDRPARQRCCNQSCTRSSRRRRLWPAASPPAANIWRRDAARRSMSSTLRPQRSGPYGCR